MKAITKTMQQEQIETEQAEHGVEEAMYDNLGRQLYGHACPYFRCLCGWTSSNGNLTWEEVGAEMDEHLERSALTMARLKN